MLYYISGYSNNVVSIYGSVIRRNSVPNIGHGGAVYVDGENSSLSIHRSVIESNSIQLGSEGAILLGGDSSRILIEKTSLSNNEARSGGEEYNDIDVVGSGGAIWLSGDNSHFLIENSSLSENKARRGGAIHTVGLNIYISISKSIVSKNSATKCGILNINDLRHCSVKFIDSSFVNNSANASSGGVMCIRNASISVQNDTFTHNGAAENEEYLQ